MLLEHLLYKNVVEIALWVTTISVQPPEKQLMIKHKPNQQNAFPYKGICVYIEPIDWLESEHHIINRLYAIGAILRRARVPP